MYNLHREKFSFCLFIATLILAFSSITLISQQSLQFLILFKIKSFPETKFRPARERFAGGAGGGAGRLDLRAPGLAGLTRQVLLLHLLLLQNY